MLANRRKEKQSRNISLGGTMSKAGRRGINETSTSKCHDRLDHETPPHPGTQSGGRHFGKGKHLKGHFRPIPGDKRRNRRPGVNAVSDKQPTKGVKGRFCEYHKSKTHDTVNCSVLKREMEEKQLKGNLVEVA